MIRRTNNPGAAVASALLAVAAVALPAPALAFGGRFHVTAGLLAAQKLCPAAQSGVADLGGGKSLGEVGLWADAIRPEIGRAHV